MTKINQELTWVLVHCVNYDVCSFFFCKKLKFVGVFFIYKYCILVCKKVVILTQIFTAPFMDITYVLYKVVFPMQTNKLILFKFQCSLEGFNISVQLTIQLISY